MAGKTMNKSQKRFCQGYACAVACIISSHGASTVTREALQAGGLSTIEQLEEAEIDQHDIDILMPTIKEIKQRDKDYLRAHFRKYG